VNLIQKVSGVETQYRVDSLQGKIHDKAFRETISSFFLLESRGIKKGMVEIGMIMNV
jgi:hypothetical protein